MRRKNSQSHIDHEEKPFWISFSDMMTAVMVLFLVVMCATIALIAKPNKDGGNTQADKEANFLTCAGELINIYNAKFPNNEQIKLTKNKIQFGTKAQFKTSDFQLSTEQASYLTNFVKEVIFPIQTKCDKAQEKLLSKIISEGYASRTGDYLTNLTLSLNRGKSVICALLNDANLDISLDEKKQVAKYFSVGGYSFNDSKASDYESQRVELTLEFYKENQPRNNNYDYVKEMFGKCQ